MGVGRRKLKRERRKNVMEKSSLGAVHIICQPVEGGKPKDDNWFWKPGPEIG